MSDMHYIAITRRNYERLLKDEWLLFAGENFGLENDITVLFVEDEEDAKKKIKWDGLRRTTEEQLNGESR